MYLRFRTSFPASGETRYGVFQAASFLLHNDRMYRYDREQLESVWHWFKHNLPAPDVYRQRKNSDGVICWFKPTADAHLRKMHEMISILDQYDIFVSQVKCSKPGYIVYEDENQVAAVPFTKSVRQLR